MTRNRKTDSGRRPAHRRVAFWGAVAGGFLFACTTTSAFAGDDDEATWEGKVIDKVLGGIGIQTGPGIDYRERSPLVVPPKIDLPPPEDDAAVEKKNPAWPVDADVNRRRRIEARAVSKYNSPEEELTASGRPIPRNELDRGGDPSKAPTGGNTTGALDASGRPLSQEELGSKGLFGMGNLFGFGKDKEETATFTKEPTRETLIDPPPGYRTPSPNEPYGIGAKKSESKPATLLDHGTDLR